MSLRVYCNDRTKARDDIHHKTYDGGRSNRAATAKAERKAARQAAKKGIQKDIDWFRGCSSKKLEEYKQEWEDLPYAVGYVELIRLVIAERIGKSNI